MIAIRIATTALLCVSLVIGASACSAPPSDSGVASVSNTLAVAETRGFEWEVSVLQDGDITSDEYEQAYDRCMDCQRELGYVFDKPKCLDPVEGQRWHALSAYRGAGDPPTDGIGLCEERIFFIEDAYVLLTPKRMDPQLMAKFRECLDEAEINYSGAETNFNDFVSELDDEYIDADSRYTACLVDSAFELYPDLIAVGYGR